MISKNNADVIGDCLNSVQGLADEIIVLDSGSQDDTDHRLIMPGLRCMKTGWRASAVSGRLPTAVCRRDYILMLDTDERVTLRVKQSGEQGTYRAAEIPFIVLPAVICFSGVLRNTAAGIRIMFRGYIPVSNIQYNCNAVHESLETQGLPVINH